MNRREFFAWIAAVAALGTLPGCSTLTENATAPTPPEPARAAYAARYPAPAAPRPYPAAVPVSRPGGAPRPTYPYAAPAPTGPVMVRSAPPPAYGPVGGVPAAMPPPAAPLMPPPGAYPGMGGVAAISRNSWQALPPIEGKLNPMNGVNRITVHHEGNPRPNNDVTPQQVAATLQLIQKEHRSRMNAADIGYHYIIDRSGRLWQGREERFQGAHVSGNNSNNLGILLLGNYNIQQPTPQQLATLDRLLRQLMRVHRLPASRVYCHCELGNTKCPGDNLRIQFTAMRQRL